MQPVNILGRMDLLRGGLVVKPSRQRELEEYPVDAGIGAQAPDETYYFLLGDTGVECVMDGDGCRLLQRAYA